MKLICYLQATCVYCFHLKQRWTLENTRDATTKIKYDKVVLRLQDHETLKTSSYPGWIKSPHVVTLSILKLSDLDYLTIFMGGGYSGVNFGHPKSEVFRIFYRGGIPE